MLTAAPTTPRRRSSMRRSSASSSSLCGPKDDFRSIGLTPLFVLHVLEGHLRLGIDKRTLELAPGGLVAMDADLPHDLEALDECAVLLIIGGKHGRRARNHDAKDA